MVLHVVHRREMQYGKKAKYVKGEPSGPQRRRACPGLSVRRVLCEHCPALNFHGVSVVLAASSHSRKLKGFWEAQQKGTGCPCWHNLSGLQPLPCCLLRSIRGRDGSWSRLCERPAGATSESGPPPSVRVRSVGWAP